MLRRMRHALVASALLLAGLVAAGGETKDNAEVEDGIDVYFRDVDLSALSDQSLAEYIAAEPGESQLLDRAFPGAPPQISHTVEELPPITATENECVECHHPDNVAGEEDAPLPESHFERPVMAAGAEGEAMLWVVKGYEKAEDLVGSRYDCTMCHVPQATNVRTPPSLFKREPSGRD